MRSSFGKKYTPPTQTENILNKFEDYKKKKEV